MGFIDVLASPQHVKDALQAQGGVPFQQAAGIVAVWETLRDEAVPEGQWERVVHVDEASSEMIFRRVDDAIDDLLKYLRLYTATEEGGDDAHEQFEKDFREFAKLVVGGRVAYAMMRSAEVSSDRSMRFDEKRMRVGVKDGALAVDDEYTPQQLRVFRAAWIVKEIVFSEYRNLKENEVNFIKKVAEKDSSEIDEDILDALEHVFIRAQPNHLYLTDPRNFDELHESAVQEAVKAVKAQTSHGEHAELFSRFLEMVDAGERINQQTLSSIFRAVAKGKIDSFKEDGDG